MVSRTRTLIASSIAGMALIATGLAAPSAQGAGTNSCSRSGATMTVKIASSSAVTIKRSGGSFKVTGKGITDTTCGKSKVTTIDTVKVSGTGGSNTLTIDLSGGAFAPGVTTETGVDPVSEIEFAVNLKLGSDKLVVKGTSADDTMTMGSSGLNTNDDDDVDLTLVGGESAKFVLGGGSDAFSGNGDSVTGGPVSVKLTLDGGTDADILLGGNNNDTLIGGSESDLMQASQGADKVSGGDDADTISTFDLAGDDTVDCGDDADVVTNLDAGDTFTDCETFPAPNAPTLTSTEPASPGNDTTPAVSGTTDEGSSVEIFASADCSGTAVGSAPDASAFGAGVTVTVPAGTTTPLTAVATSAFGATSECSDALSYQEINTAAEIEPNENSGQADTNAASGLLFDESVLVVSGSLAASELDYHTVQLATPQVVRFEVFTTGGSDCTAASTFTLQLYNSLGTFLLADSTSGIGNCPAFVVPLAAGTYHAVLVGGASPIASYQLEAAFLDDLGSETEPNNTVGTAVPLSAPNGFALGSHPSAADDDYYAVTVSAGQSLRIELIEGDLSETCQDNGIDSLVELYAPDGTTQLTSDDDNGRGFCSRIDGTGATPQNAGAHNLAAGTYYIKVSNFSGASVSQANFVYRLAITAR